MGLFGKILTIGRAKVSETGEAIVDANALTIAEQELRDARNGIKQSEDTLRDLMARRELEQQKITPIQEKIDGYVNQARQLGQEHELFNEIANEVKSLKSSLEPIQAVIEEYDASIEEVRASIDEAKRTISESERELATIKAQQAASEAVAQAAGTSGTDLSELRGSFDRIKANTAKKRAEAKAQRQMNQVRRGGKSSLDEKLAAASGGGGSSASDELAAML